MSAIETQEATFSVVGPILWNDIALKSWAPSLFAFHKALQSWWFSPCYFYLSAFCVWMPSCFWFALAGFHVVICELPIVNWTQAV